MSFSDVHDICDFPLEIVAQLTQHVSFHDHAQWLLVDRRHRNCLSTLLYLRLVPLSRTDTSLSEDDATRFTRKDVVRWAIEHGQLCTLKNVDGVEDIASFFDTTLTLTSAGLELTPMHLAALHGHTSIITYLLGEGANVNVSTKEGIIPLYLAKTGDVVHLLAEHGSRFDSDDVATASGVSALASSISHQCEPSVVEALIQLGADPNHVAPDGMTAAETAIIHGNVGALGALVDSGIDANTVLPTGEPLLYKAIWLGARDHSIEVAHAMATVLLERGASPNGALDSHLEPYYNSEACHTPTLLLATMIHSSADLVQLLLERGADQNAPYTRYRGFYYGEPRPLRGFEQIHHETLLANVVLTILRSSVHPPDPHDLRKLELLVQYGGDIDTTVQDRTLLHFILLQDGLRAQKALDVIQPLVALGADATRLDAQGDSTLHHLCGSFFSRVQQHWDYSLSVWYIRLHRPSPVASLIDLFIHRGADPNARDARGRTPLMLLCRHPQTVPTAFLIGFLLTRHRSVDVRAVDEQGCNAIHYATGEPANPFHQEPCFRLQVLLSRGSEAAMASTTTKNAPLGVSDVNAYNNLGRTPLHLLLERRYIPSGREHENVQRRIMHKMRALAMLIRAGANVRARTRPSEGDTPLHLALQGHGEPEMLLTTQLLLRHGASADINYVSPTLGLTPLMMVVAAAGRGELSRNTTENMVRLLLNAGADAQIQDPKGRTAWDMFLQLKSSKTTLSLPLWTACLQGVAPSSSLAEAKVYMD